MSNHRAAVPQVCGKRPPEATIEHRARELRRAGLLLLGLTLGLYGIAVAGVIGLAILVA